MWAKNLQPLTEMAYFPKKKKKEKVKSFLTSPRSQSLFRLRRRGTNLPFANREGKLLKKKKKRPHAAGTARGKRGSIGFRKMVREKRPGYRNRKRSA